MSDPVRGCLVMVGTPLGNRGDLAPRAREAMVSADLLLCEDTRSPARLLPNEGLPPKMSCFEGNEAGRVDAVLAALAEGKRVAYVSEAGMPGWSDPGQVLVDAALDAGFAVDVVPGPTAAATAALHSGFAASTVRFSGFVPRKGAARREWFDAIQASRDLEVVFEAPTRLPALLRELAEELPSPRRVSLARELTKLHQQVLRGRPAEVLAELEFPVRGECTLCIEGASAAARAVDAIAEHGREVLATALDPSLKPREKAKRLAALTGQPSSEIYDALGRLRPKRE